MVTDELDGDITDGDTARPPAGDAQIDGILAVLERLEDLPVAQHVDVYLDVHDRLSGELNPEQKLRQAGAHGAS